LYAQVNFSEPLSFFYLFLYLQVNFSEPLLFLYLQVNFSEPLSFLYLFLYLQVYSSEPLSFLYLQVYSSEPLSFLYLQVNFSEPLSFLQRLMEDFEYSDCLDNAAACTDDHEQMAYVAAFTVSSYANTTLRTGKPFNPLLGETFECDRYEDLGWRSFAEQVCCCCTPL